MNEVGLEPTKPFQAGDLQSPAIAAMRPIHYLFNQKLVTITSLPFLFVASLLTARRASTEVTLN